MIKKISITQILILGFILLLSQSCSKKNPDSMLQLFPKEAEIRGTIMPIKENLLGHPMELINIDSLLIIVEFGSDTWLNIISSKTGRQINTCLTLGKGPTDVQYLKQISVYNNTKFFDIYDSQTRKLHTYYIDSILNDREITPIKTSSFEFAANKFFDILKYKSNFISTGIIWDGKYAILDSAGNTVNVCSNYPADPKHPHVDYDILGMAYQGTLKTKPNGKRMVWAGYSSDMFEIYEIEDHQLNIIKNYCYDLPIYEEERGGMGGFSASPLSNSKRAFNDMDVTEKYIYTLYSGRSREECDIETAIKGNTILIFDWDGNPIKNLKLDRLINRFTVSSDNKFIYAIAETPYPVIVKYPINMNSN